MSPLSSYQENDFEEIGESRRPLENSLGERHRKCILLKKDIIRELKKENYVMFTLRRVKRCLFMYMRLLR